MKSITDMKWKESVMIDLRVIKDRLVDANTKEDVAVLRRAVESSVRQLDRVVDAIDQHLDNK